MKARIIRGDIPGKAGLDRPKEKKRAPLDGAPSSTAQETRQLDRKVVANLAEPRAKAKAKAHRRSAPK